MTIPAMNGFLKKMLATAAMAMLVCVATLPATIAHAGKVSFTEVDGDVVTVKTKLGTDAQLESALGINNGATGVGAFTINFIANSTLSAAFAGTDVSVKASGAGDKLANTVRINAFDGNTGIPIDLGKVTIKGHLQYVDAGDTNLETPAIKKLDVVSWGPEEPGNNATSSEIHGDIDEIKVRTNFDGFIISKDANGSPDGGSNAGTVIAKFTVGQDIADLEGNDVGHIEVNNIGKLAVKGTFFGSTGGSMDNGLIEAVSLDGVAVHRMSVNAAIRLY